MTESTTPTGKVYRIVVLAFQGKDTAQKVVNDARNAGALEGFRVVTEALADRDEKGKLDVHQTGRGGVGAGIGAVAGGALSLLAGPVGLLGMVVAGATVGGVAGHFLGREIPMDDLRKVAEALPADSSALLLLLEDREAEKALKAVEGLHADIVVIDLGSELSGVVAEAVMADVSIDPAATPEPESTAGSTPAS
jgi:uncharacterized membrane protein